MLENRFYCVAEGIIPFKILIQEMDVLLVRVTKNPHILFYYVVVIHVCDLWDQFENTSHKRNRNSCTPKKNLNSSCIVLYIFIVMAADLVRQGLFCDPCIFKQFNRLLPAIDCYLPIDCFIPIDYLSLISLHSLIPIAYKHPIELKSGTPRFLITGFD